MDERIKEETLEEENKKRTCCNRYVVKMAIAMSCLILLCVGIILLILGYTINNRIDGNGIVITGLVLFGLSIMLMIISFAICSC